MVYQGLSQQSIFRRMLVSSGGLLRLIFKIRKIPTQMVLVEIFDQFESIIFADDCF
jgi:hypothetical protein